MSPKRNTKRASVKVGLLLLASLGGLMLGILLIGEQNNLFRPMNKYSVRFPDVDGLQAGNPVQLNGVAVGRVTDIVLPEDPDQNLLTVWIAVDQRFARRVRKDSTARIQTLGLLGDKYIDLTAGTGTAVVINDGGEVNAAPVTDVDLLIHSGEDAVQNIVAISSSLARILDRVEKGDSVLGELLAPLPEDPNRRPVMERVYGTLDSVDRIMAGIEEGKGPLGRLLFDDQAGQRLASSIERFEGLLKQIESGEGLLPALLYDPTLKQDAATTLSDLRSTAQQIQELVTSVEEAEGLLPKLLEDEAYAERVLSKVEGLVDRLDSLSSDLAEGDGTVSQLIRDPEVYQALNDVIVGVNESRLLRWLIRNRQKAGIKKRYRDAQAPPESDAATSLDPPTEGPEDEPGPTARPFP